MLFAPEQVEQRDDDGKLPVKYAGRCGIETIYVHRQKG